MFEFDLKDYEEDSEYDFIRVRCWDCGWEGKVEPSDYVVCPYCHSDNVE